MTKAERVLLADIDAPCRALVQAMNSFPGIRTSESCCGHEDMPVWIFFTADSLEALPPLLYWFSACHSGVSGWVVEARTDCAMSPVHFLAASRSKEEVAYREAAQIARKMAGREKEEQG